MTDDTGENRKPPDFDARIAALGADKLALLAHRLAASRGTPPQRPLARAGGGNGIAAPSFAQQRLWLLDRLLPGGSEYNESFAAALTGDLRVEALRSALDAIVRRHDVLRARFVLLNQSPMQVIEPERVVGVDVEDLRALPEDARRAEALRRASDEALATFDLSAGPLLRVRLLRLGERTHWLLLTLHHIVTDGWSSAVLARELSALYGAHCRGEASPLPELPVQYADYAAWQREFLQGTVLETQLGYWKRALADLPELDLPTDRPRPAVASHRGESLGFVFDAGLARGLLDLGRREGATLFMTLLAAFQVLLCRWTGQEDVAVGVPIAGRTRPEFDGLLGCFVNTLVLRGDLSGTPGFRDYLAQVRERALDAYAHQDLPFEKLVEALAPKRDLSRNPLVQVSFNLVNVPRAALELDGVTVERLPQSHTSVKFDVSLRVEDIAGRLHAAFEYSTDLFDASTIERVAGHWRTLLEGIVADPEMPISRLPLLTPGERHRVLTAWDATAQDYPRNACLHTLFEAAAARAPDAVAAVFMARQLTYEDLNARANQLAHHLRGLGVGPDVRVAVAMERSLELVVALLGVLKAGGAYVPLEPDHPPQRLAFMLEDTQAIALLTQHHLLDSMPPLRCRVLCLDTEASVIQAQPETNPSCTASATSLAYVAYTSGSTGEPKGVLIEHRGACNHLHGFARAHAVSRDDRVLQTAPIGFDVSLWQLLLPLLSGARLVLPEPAAHRSGDELVALIRAAGVTILRMVPTMLSVVVNTPGFAQCSSLRLVISAGEVLDPELARRFHALSNAELCNAYGPTETTFFTTLWTCRRDETRPRIPVGRPIGNARVYLLDGLGEPVPIGASGDVHIGGDGVARGYLHRPDLDAISFVADPFARTPGARMYRTGDIARRLPDGNIDLLGRRDRQVKVRGVRIEPGEIEAALARQPQVRQAVVVLREDVPGEKRLVAYVCASDDTVSAADLRAVARQSLPDSMVPAAFVLLPELPLTRNGKVDRRALPVPTFDHGTPARVLPRTPIERALARAMAEVLNLDRIGIDDSFFDLGGHSLSAVRLTGRIRDALNIDLSLRQIFATPTVRGLAQAAGDSPMHPSADEPDAMRGGTREITAAPAMAAHIAALGPETRAAPARQLARQDGHLSIPPLARSRDHADVTELSFAQTRLWLLDRLLPGQAVYNQPFAASLTGPLDVEALRAALHDLTQRHEVLRGRIAVRNESPVQVLLPSLSPGMQVEDLCAVPADERAALARHRAHEEARAPFDLESGPLLRARLLRLGEQSHWLLLTLHHIVTDGWSSAVLARELSALYGAHRRGERSPLAELRVQYADYAAWQRKLLQGNVLDAQLRYWKRVLADLPALNLPTDHPRPEVMSHRGGRVAFEFGAEATRVLREVGRREGATLFMTLLAAFQVLLFRHTGQEDVAVGVPIAGRTQSELDGLIGFFVNTLVLRGDLSGEPSFRTHLERTREQALAAYAHQDLPFERLVEELAPKRDLSRNPLVQVAINLVNVPRADLRLDGLTVEVLPESHITARFDLTLTVREHAGQLDACFEYSTDLFEHATIERLAEQWRVLLAAIVADPAQPIARLPLLPPMQQRQLLSGRNAAAADYPRDLCVHQLFEHQVARSPDAVALVFEDRQLTYGELNASANRLAHRLLRCGVGTGVLVGLCVERSLEMIVALLGVLKTGAAYVPLDPGWPPERARALMEDAGLAAVLVRPCHADQLPPTNVAIVLVDSVPPTGVRDDGNPDVAVAPTDPVYVLYTSGSTGRPKGVLIEHRHLLHYVWAIVDRLELTADGSYAMVQPLTVDSSQTMIFPSLGRGGKLHLISDTRALDATGLAGYFRRHCIDYLKIAPSHLAALLDRMPSAALLPRRALIVGGEASHWAFIDRIRALGPRCALWNHYGPTETTVGASVCRLDPKHSRASATVPIGRPLPNVWYYILDQHRQLVPFGVRGELFIGGYQVARGYLNRPELTAERFLPDPFGDGPETRLYATGDQVRYLSDGQIEFLGRNDHQVKIRGFRVEPGEIEAALRTVSGVRAAAVVAKADSAEGKRLLAFIVPEPDVVLEDRALRSELAMRLPDHMMPSQFILLSALPLTPHGKVDQKSLELADGVQLAPGDAYVAPRSRLEQALAQAMAELLNLDRIGIDDSFFDLGGHSLSAVRLTGRIREALNIDLSLRQLFATPTVRGLAQAAVDSPAARATDLPLSPRA